MDAGKLSELIQGTSQPWLMMQGIRENDAYQQKQLADLYKQQQTTAFDAQDQPLKLEGLRVSNDQGRAAARLNTSSAQAAELRNEAQLAIPYEERVRDYITERRQKMTKADLEDMNTQFGMLPGFIAEMEANGGKLPLETQQRVATQYKNLMPLLSDPTRARKAYTGYVMASKQGILQDDKQEAAKELARIQGAYRNAQKNAPKVKTTGDKKLSERMNNENSFNYWSNLAFNEPEGPLKDQYEKQAKYFYTAMAQLPQIKADAQRVGDVDLEGRGIPTIKPPNVTPPAFPKPQTTPTAQPQFRKVVPKQGKIVVYEKDGTPLGYADDTPAIRRQLQAEGKVFK